MKKAILLGLLLVGVLIGYTASLLSGEEEKDIGAKEAKAAAEQFINNNLIPPESDQKAQVNEVAEENGLYKVAVSVGGQDVDSYITKDGTKFFPQGMNVDSEEEDPSSQESGQQENQEVSVDTKKDTPSVELFVMSYCPYGTQAQKAFSPVVELLGDKVDFELQFCDYLMHGEEELEENLRQHCIQKEQPERLWAYLDCFLENEDAESCMEEAEVNVGQIEQCAESTDEEYRVTEKMENNEGYKGNYPPFDVDKEDNEKYGVSGSPTLVVNGETVQAPRNPKSLLTTICSGFTEEPEECSEQLPSSTPSPGFGSSQANSTDSTAGCQ